MRGWESPFTELQSNTNGQEKTPQAVPALCCRQAGAPKEAAQLHGTESAARACTSLGGGSERSPAPRWAEQASWCSAARILWPTCSYYTTLAALPFPCSGYLGGRCRPGMMQRSHVWVFRRSYRDQHSLAENAAVLTTRRGSWSFTADAEVFSF